MTQETPYKKESLGRPAKFLLPANKILDPKIREKIRNFLLENFGGYTETSSGVFIGCWKNKENISYDAHVEFRISFLGKERIPVLEQFLAKLARELDEECIYLETGEDAWLIYALKHNVSPAWSID